MTHTTDARIRFCFTSRTETAVLRPIPPPATHEMDKCLVVRTNSNPPSCLELLSHLHQHPSRTEKLQLLFFSTKMCHNPSRPFGHPFSKTRNHSQRCWSFPHFSTGRQFINQQLGFPFSIPSSKLSWPPSTITPDFRQVRNYGNILVTSATSPWCRSPLLTIDR